MTDLLSLLDVTIGGNPLSRWLLALVVALAGSVAFSTLSRVLVGRFRRIAEGTTNDVDDLIAHLLEKTRFVLVLLVAAWAGSQGLVLGETSQRWFRGFVVIGLFLQLALWGTGIVNYLLERHQREQLEEDPGSATAIGALGFVARVALWSVVLLLVLDNLGVDITALLAGMGVGGIAVALAVQNVLGDLLASLSIVLDKPFVIGDFVVVDELAGTVEHVGLKTTRIRSLTGEQLVFSNSDLLESRIRNYKRMAERRIAFTVGVEYGTPPDLLERLPGIIRGVVDALPNARFDRSHFKTFGDSSLNFETVYYVTVPDYEAYMNAQQAINLALYRTFAEEGVEFAFPTRTLWVRRDDPPSAEAQTEARVEG